MSKSNYTKSEAAINRWSNSDQRAAQSEKAKARTGQAASRSKTWSLEMPSKTLKLVTGCRAFCEANDLSYTALKRKAATNDDQPVSRGKSKGWSVLAVTPIIKAS